MACRVASALVLAVALAQGGAAQENPVAWEPLPVVSGRPGTTAHNVAFLLGAGPADGGLVWISDYGPLLYAPGAPGTWEGSDWVKLCAVGCAPFDGLVTDAGSVLIGAPAGATAIDRLPPGGPWEYEVNNAGGGTTTLFQASIPALSGADGRGFIFGGSYFADRSDDDGRDGSWARLGEPGGEVVVFGEVPPSDALPRGRLLAGLYNGVAFSDDGGATWAPGAGAYGFARYVAGSFAFVPEAGHPYGGAVLAGVDDLEWGRDSTATVYRSDDGGATWARAHRFSPSALGLANTNTVALLATPDGAVWAGVTYLLGGNSRYRTGTVARSTDGGRTWTKMAEGYGGHGVEAVRLGPDGRLYVGSVVGVWRTTAPLVAVAGAPAPPTNGGPAVRVFPNPAGAAVEVAVRLGAPAWARVEVVDVRGRVVAVAHDGPLPAEAVVRLGVEGLAPGAYVVRVVAGGAQASARLVVTR